MIMCKYPISAAVLLAAYFCANSVMISNAAKSKNDLKPNQQSGRGYVTMHIKTQRKSYKAPNTLSYAVRLKRIQTRNNIIKCCGKKSCKKTPFKKTPANKIHLSKSLNASIGKISKIIRNELNGPSNKLVAIGKKKYKFPPQKATFQEAEKLCSEQGLQVTSLSGKKESAKLDEYLSYIGFGSEPMFVSMTSGVMEKGVTWGKESPPGGPGSCLMQYKGALYNSSCDQSAQYTCQEQPIPDHLTTLGSIDNLPPLENAVLNFVGGKNIVMPSERQSVPEANTMCASQGMELMSLKSLTELSSVQDFLGDIGISTGTILTSMSKLTGDGGSANWLGDLASAFLPPQKNAPEGDCMGLSSLGLQGIPCDTVSNFVCQAPEPKLLGENGAELPFSADLLKAADSLGIQSATEDVVTIPLPVDFSRETQRQTGAATTALKPKTERPVETTPIPTQATTVPGTTAKITSPSTTTMLASTTSSPTSSTATSTSTSRTTARPIAATVNAVLSIIVAAVFPTAAPAPTQTSLTPTTTTTLPPIPLNFTAMERQYISPNISLSFDNAADWCIKKEMRLVVVETSKEFDSILTAINSSQANTSIFYTGMAKKSNYTAKGYKLDTKVEETFNATLDGECMTLASSSAKGVPCTELQRFICEQVKNHSHVNASLTGKYSFPANLSLTFNEYKTYCANMNASMAKISDFFELVSELQYLIDTMNLTNTTVFVELDKVSGAFPKTSTSLLLIWADGHPNNSLDCVAIFNRTLITVTCSDMYPSICEISNTPAKNTTLTINNETYTVSSEMINPQYGKMYCEKNGFQFVSVEIGLEHRAILVALKTAGMDAKEIAINLRQIQGSFAWDTNSTLTPRSVGWTELPKTSDSCGAYLNGSVIMSDCQKPKLILCEERKPFELNYQSFNNSDNTHRYIRFPDLNLTHSAAAKYCADAGFTLTVLDTDFEIKEDIVPLNITDEMYISLELTGSTANSYKVSRFNNWLMLGHSNPNIYLKDQCLTLKNGALLLPTDCQAPLAFLCEDIMPPLLDNDTRTIKAVAAAWPTPPDSDFFTIQSDDQTTHYYFSNNGTTSFEQARNTCQSFGLDLAMLESEQETKFIAKHIDDKGLKEKYFYIGLHKMGHVNYTWWINNVTVSYTGWLPGDPASFASEHCAIMNKGGWRDLPCVYGSKFIHCWLVSNGSAASIGVFTDASAPASSLYRLAGGVVGSGWYMICS